jgi:hypothetical protein
VNRGLLVRGFTVGFKLMDASEACLKFFVNVARHDNHVLEYLLLVKELWKRILNSFIQPAKRGEEFIPVFQSSLLPIEIFLVDVSI